MSKFTAVIVPALEQGDCYVQELDGYKQIQAKVDGTFDVVRCEFMGHTLSIYDNDEGLIFGLPTNIVVSLIAHRRLVGDAVIAGGVSPDGEQLSVPESLIPHLVEI